MSRINYVTGDATQPVSTPAIIAHICNNRGGWGAGFTGALSKRWPRAEEYYRHCWGEKLEHSLGHVQIVRISPDIIVANMIAQDGYSRPGKPAIRYSALENCLDKVRGCALYIRYIQWSVHMPRIGTGLAGGDWAVIEPMIVRELCEKGVEVTVYDLPVTKGN